jgi:hypothetical protein
MARSRPTCDKHPNLQMMPCSLQTMEGKTFGFVCAVPGCGRYYGPKGYFDAPVEGAESEIKLNRRAAAREAILRAIRGRPQ